MTDWTKEEDEAFNAVEKQSNLGKHILKDMGGQPYHWEIDAIQAAVRMEREECAKVVDAWSDWNGDTQIIAKAIRARGQE